MPRQSPDDIFLIDNRACLNLSEIGRRPDGRDLPWLEQGGLSDLEFYPAELSPAVVAGSNRRRPLISSLPAFCPSRWSVASPQMAGNDVRVYAVGNNYLHVQRFQANGWEGWGIFEYARAWPIPVPSFPIHP